MKKIITHHFVKTEDLNHHGTLYAGRTAEWFVEAGLMAAAQDLVPENIVCVKIHGMNFSHPIHLGDTVKFVSQVVYAGRTSVIANIALYDKGAEILNDFITFVNVDSEGKPKPHHLQIVPETEEEKALQQKAFCLKK